MSLLSTIKAMEQADIPAEQILQVIKNQEKMKLEKDRLRKRSARKEEKQEKTISASLDSTESTDVADTTDKNTSSPLVPPFSPTPPIPPLNPPTNTHTSARAKPKNQNRPSLEELTTDHIRDWLAEKRGKGRYLCHDEEHVLEVFKNYCLSKEVKYKDYVAALRNAFDWERCQPKSGGKKSKHQSILDAIDGAG